MLPSRRDERKPSLVLSRQTRENLSLVSTRRRLLSLERAFLSSRLDPLVNTKYKINKSLKYDDLLKLFYQGYIFRVSHGGWYVRRLRKTRHRIVLKIWSLIWAVMLYRSKILWGMRRCRFLKKVALTLIF